MGRKTLLHCAAGAATSLAIACAGPAWAQDEGTVAKFPKRDAVPGLSCQKGDRPEPDLQGRVPPTDTTIGRFAIAYSCNLQLVGHLPGTTWASLDSFGDCA